MMMMMMMNLHAMYESSIKFDAFCGEKIAVNVVYPETV